MTIPPELLTALSALLVALMTYIATELRKNTKITKQVEEQTNGRLAAKDAEIAALKQQVQVARFRAEALTDIVRYIKSQPESRPILERYENRRRVYVPDADLERLLSASVEDIR